MINIITYLNISKKTKHLCTNCNLIKYHKNIINNIEEEFPYNFKVGRLLLVHDLKSMNLGSYISYHNILHILKLMEIVTYV